MHWKERLFTFLTSKKPWTKHRIVDFEYFISTEIIEKLIEDIPDDLTYDRREGIWHEVGGSKQIKQQLRDKWL